MGYELHIARESYNPADETTCISLEEWLEYVNRDNELELSDGLNIGVDEVVKFSNGPVYWEWNAHPTETRPDARPWFAYWKGSIGTKNPDMLIVRKMLQIASALNAVVEGDNGEIYTEEYIAELEKETITVSLEKPVKRRWWKFW